MKVDINQTQSSESQVRVRRRNVGEFDHVNVNIPKEINQKINGIIAKTEASRSLVISELLREAFDAREGK